MNREFERSLTKVWILLFPAPFKLHFFYAPTSIGRHTCTHTRTCAHKLVNTFTCKHTHKYVLPQTPINTYTHTHNLFHEHAHTHTETHTYTRIHTQRRTHTRTHITHTHTHKHTHTHTGDITSMLAPPDRGAAAAHKHTQRMRSMSPDSCPTAVRGGGLAHHGIVRSSPSPGTVASCVMHCVHVCCRHLCVCVDLCTCVAGICVYVCGFVCVCV
jgi:hypothetical protein